MKFPLFAANMTNPDGKLVAGFKDRDIVTLGGVRIGLTGARMTARRACRTRAISRLRRPLRPCGRNARRCGGDGVDLVSW